MEVVPEIPREHIEIFITEAEEQIEIWERGLLGLEKDTADSVLLNDVFRAIHTFKGSAGFVGLDEIKNLTHELETTIQDVVDGSHALDSPRMELLFDGLDVTKTCIAAMKEDRKAEVDLDSLIAAIRKCNAGGEPAAGQIVPSSNEAPAFEDFREPAPDAGSGRTYRLELEITADESEAFLRGLLIQSKLEDVGEILEIEPPLEDLRSQGDGFRFYITVRSDRAPDFLRKTADIDQVSVLSLLDVTDHAVAVTAGTESGPGPDEDEVTPRPRKMEEVVRVHVNKLDSMMNLVGELVVANSRFISILAKGREKYGDLDILNDLRGRTDALAQIARNLQDTVTRVSMLPVATIFSRFHRVVRDLAKYSGKDVDLQVFGEETEIDKRILDGISEPLIHLLRNAVDHGIEKPEDRTTFGKEATGTIRIGAYQEGDHICVVLSDDGIGIDRQAVIGKAVSKGIIEYQKADTLTDQQVYDLLFSSGFSTAAEVTDVSGRGIGLDIVKKTVEDLGGSVRIESTFGLGTSTTITLPLTTVIINSLVVGTAGAVFAFPMSSVLEMIRPKWAELRPVQQGRVICLRDDIIPVLDLVEVLWPNTPRADLTRSDSDEVTIIIVDHNRSKAGFIVDRLMGKQEIVVKSLSKNYKETEGLIGATIMGSGKVGLILDVKGILNSYYRDRLGPGAPIDVTAGPAVAPAAINRTVPAAAPVVPGRSESGAEERSAPDAPVAEPPAAGPESAEPEIPKLPDVQIVEEQLPPLNAEEAEKLQEVMIDGAINASESMTELLGREVRVSFPDVKVVSLENITESFGGDEAPVAGIFVEFAGDISGVWAIVIAMDDIPGIADYLMGRPAGSTNEIGETEISALKEMGNILTAAFTRSIVDASDLDVHLKVPEMSVDMCLAVMDSILVRFNQPGRQLLVTEAELFSMETQSEVCRLLILMEQESTSRLVQVLTREPRGLLARARMWLRRFSPDDELMGDGGEQIERNARA